MQEAFKPLVANLLHSIQLEMQALPMLNAEALRTLRRRYSKHLALASPGTMLELAQQFIELETFPFRFVAYELIHHHKATLQSLGAKNLEALARGLDGWESVDTFSCYLAGPVWREHQVPDALIHRWARSKDRWFRRAALVSTVPLNNKARGGSRDSDRTLAVCEKLMDDRDDMVVKALSWALRELAKRDPRAVQSFIRQHSNRLAPRVLREVRNKLSTGLKNPSQKSRR